MAGNEFDALLGVLHGGDVTEHQHIALERAIVIHGAPYVSDALVRAQGRLGRSLGCPAVGTAVAKPLIDSIRGGSFLFAYYPDPAWLKHSRLLGADCGSGVAAHAASPTPGG